MNRLFSNEYVELVRNKLISYPAKINVDTVNNTMGGGGGDSGGIDIEIIGEDLDIFFSFNFSAFILIY